MNSQDIAPSRSSKRVLALSLGSAEQCSLGQDPTKGLEGVRTAEASFAARKASVVAIGSCCFFVLEDICRAGE